MRPRHFTFRQGLSPGTGTVNYGQPTAIHEVQKHSFNTFTHLLRLCSVGQVLFLFVLYASPHFSNASQPGGSSPRGDLWNGEDGFSGYLDKSLFPDPPPSVQSPTKDAAAGIEESARVLAKEQQPAAAASKVVVDHVPSADLDDIPNLDTLCSYILDDVPKEQPPKQLLATEHEQSPESPDQMMETPPPYTSGSNAWSMEQPPASEQVEATNDQPPEQVEVTNEQPPPEQVESTNDQPTEHVEATNDQPPEQVEATNDQPTEQVEATNDQPPEQVEATNEESTEQVVVTSEESTELPPSQMLVTPAASSKRSVQYNDDSQQVRNSGVCPYCIRPN